MMSLLEVIDNAISWRNDNEEELRQARVVLSYLLDSAGAVIEADDEGSLEQSDIERLRRALAAAQGGKSDG